ncbi:hypothetical protein [Actinomyces faecalis]|uniref:rhamnosyltransferase WsaF family glycosyltransferase n=1 Tax=Actinomyces faecalis TaxID=2722820 RepID=UPI001553F34B|nr:hypothetical protein [Actinomyces faecalis]
MMDIRRSVTATGFRATRRLVRALDREIARLDTQLQHHETRLSEKIDTICHGGPPTAAAFLQDLSRLTRPFNVKDVSSERGPAVLTFGSLDTSASFGGMATLFRVADAIAAQSNRPLIVAQTTGARPAAVREVFTSLRSQTPTSRIESQDLRDRHSSTLRLHADDIIVVSAWQDAATVASLPLNHPFVYLIQDFEPIFFANSDSYLNALSTYRIDNFIPLFNSSVLKDFFLSQGLANAADASFFEPAVQLPVSIHQKPHQPRIFFYARRSVERNLFETGLASIAAALHDPKLADWEVHCAGDDTIPSVRMPNGSLLVNHGKMAPEQYFNFIANCDLCVSPMLAPHPNYPTLEFAAAGIPVVTTAWQSKNDLSRYSPLIRTVDPTIDSMRDAILRQAALTTEERQQLSSRTSIPTSWNETLNPPAQTVLRKLIK